MFENHAKIIIGVERLMLEASGFDFRNRYPQRLLLKIAKVYRVDRATIGKAAYNMSLDLYRTFAPLKQTTSTMAIACVELAGRVHDQPVAELEAGKDYEKWQTTRQEVMGLFLGFFCVTLVSNSNMLISICRNAPGLAGLVYASPSFNHRGSRLRA